MDWELIDLVLHLAAGRGSTISEDSELEELEEFIYNEYSIDIDDFASLMKDLLPLCDRAESPLTKKLYSGFGANEVWLLKQEVK